MSTVAAILNYDRYGMYKTLLSAVSGIFIHCNEFIIFLLFEEKMFYISTDNNDHRCNVMTKDHIRRQIYKSNNCLFLNPVCIYYV